MLEIARQSAPSVDAESQHLLHVQGLFLQHFSSLRAFLHSIVPDHALTDDVVQETFLTVTQKSADFTAGSNFWAWLCRIARYKALECAHRRNRASSMFSPEVLEALESDQPPPDSDDEQLLRLRECLEKLAPKARRAIELRYLETQDAAAIARDLGWKIEAVYVALSRARSAIRNCVESGPETPMKG